MSATLDSRQMLAFATLARRGSFTMAAKDLFLTQSAVSHTIKTFEREMGVRLFDRVGKKVHLTQAGEQLLPPVERILREMQDARTALEELQNWGQGRLRVGASTTACHHILPTVLREFKQSFPSCVIKIESGDHPRQLELLRSNQVDIALTLESESNAADLVFRPLFEDELRFLVSPMHPWAAKRKAPREDIAAETLVLYNKSSYTFRLVDEYFREEGVSMQNVIELGSMEAIKELVKIGMGAGVLAPWIAREELAKGALVSIPLGKRKLKRRWGVSFLKGRKLPLAEETFAGLCEAVTQDFGRVSELGA
ncbi:LysR family transcriptional regulator [Rariglobus hedericola]|uniref:LysR family transcriptional regulator n=1 Tax=Rariglobus hedericola TaxID=2597822 RepID=A0A556QQ95_9BACT|nr:LysR family transcriptional regulator [Rariglobus hedericola]TSJ78810.1 LysR family transcriptional regulator [Rariglobus hedericola]